MTVLRSSSEKSHEFWEGVDRSAAEVAKWPDWKIDRPRVVQVEAPTTDADSADDNEKAFS